MHSVARVILVGFRHKRGGKAVFARNAFDQKLEQPRVIRRLQSIGLVHHIDFELSGACLGNQCVGGYIHRLAGIINFGKELIKSIKLPEGQNFGLIASFA